MNAIVQAQSNESFEDAIKQHLLDNRPRLVEQAIQSAFERMSESLKYTALQQAELQLKEFFKTDVAPAVQDYLDKNREQLVAKAIATIQTVLDAALKMQSEEWIKESASQYSRAGVISKMFGGRGY